MHTYRRVLAAISTCPIGGRGQNKADMNGLRDAIRVNEGLGRWVFRLRDFGCSDSASRSQMLGFFQLFVCETDFVNFPATDPGRNHANRGSQDAQYRDDYLLAH